jgi:aminopeptidase N
MRWRECSIAVVLAAGLCSVEPACAGQPVPPLIRQAEILHHTLEVKLVPDRHELLAVDQMTVRALADDVHEAAFTLNGNLHALLVVEQRPAGAHALAFRAAPATGPSNGAGQTVTVRFDRPLQADETVTLLWQYRGEINEPPREPRHLRFVTPSETAGHIGAEGVYLSGETLWYPDLPGSLPTFALRAKTPGEWTAVTQGRQLVRAVQDSVATADWEVAEKTEALTLVANRFVVKQRDWPDPSGRPIEIAAYLFADEAHLADEYLDASIRYLDAYIRILGPYPFPKFAVVENFFASGLGMPSFTLLGSGIVKRRYVQPYALGHEIVHSWIGNSVFNAVEEGNWVEGLTTYLANYYYEELTGTPEQAREQRRMMLLGYAVYVRPEEDYPVAQFRQKTDQKDNAIGYQKSAMVFHMLRREIGEKPFWHGIRTLAARYRGRYAGWKDVEQVFAETAGLELRRFFAQWVERAGVPPASKDRPSVRTDPGYDIFRRIPREVLPPMLNLVVTDPLRTVIVPGGGSEPDRVPYVELIAQIVSKDPASAMQDDRHAEAAKGSLLVLGGPGVNWAAEWAVRGCGGAVRVEKDSVTVEGRTYNGPGMAALLSCRHPDRAGHVVTLFYGATPAAAAKVARLLFFYGWQSYLVFQDGSVVARGDYAGSRDREAQVHDP